MSETSTRQQESVAEALVRVAARLAASLLAVDATTGQGLLDARAAALARPLAHRDHTASADELDLLVFLVGDERLGIPLDSIVAIVRASAVTPLPRAVAPVYGVTAWRGRPLTVLSVGGRLTEAVDRRLIVLGDGRRAVIGLLADSVDDTRLISRSALSPARGGARGLLAMGVTDDAVLVLDAEVLRNAARPES